MPSKLKNIGVRFLNAVLPPLCLGCDAPAGGQASLCPECWKKIQFISAPFCHCCGAPFDIPVEDGTLCGACLANRPVFESARAAMIYDEASRKIALGFKHGDRTHAAKALAVWMHRAAGESLDQADAIIPVPLHRWRLFKRRYNQSALLAQELAALSGKMFLPDALWRTRDTESQGHMKRKERQENVRGAFAVAPSALAKIKGKKITLIDDVMTTGATVEECAKTLLKSGAAQVDVLTLARVRSFV